MENKNNFTGIIIPVIISVILLTVLPIINSINVECPPCENIPTLYTPTISINDDTLTITPNSSNGAFVNGYKIYVDNILLDTTTSTTYDLSEELTEVGTYEIYVTAYATLFVDSEQSNVVEYVVEPEPSGYTVTIDIENDRDNVVVDNYSYIDILAYSIDDGENWVDIKTHNSNFTIDNVTQIKFKAKTKGTWDTIHVTTGSTDPIFGPVADDLTIGENLTVSSNTTYYFVLYID